VVRADEPFAVKQFGFDIRLKPLNTAASPGQIDVDRRRCGHVPSMRLHPVSNEPGRPFSSTGAASQRLVAPVNAGEDPLCCGGAAGRRYGGDSVPGMPPCDKSVWEVGVTGPVQGGGGVAKTAVKVSLAVVGAGLGVGVLSTIGKYAMKSDSSFFSSSTSRVAG